MTRIAIHHHEARLGRGLVALLALLLTACNNAGGPAAVAATAAPIIAPATATTASAPPAASSPPPVAPSPAASPTLLASASPWPSAVAAVATAAPLSASALKLPVNVTSADGREVTVTDISRIVSLQGNVTEVVFGLGLGDRVVGRDITATFPEAADIPLVTRAHNVSAEAVLSMRPTLVLASVNTGPSQALDHIRNVGVPVITFEEPASVDEINPRIRTIAAALGASEQGEALVARTEGSLARVRANVPANTQPPRVAFLYMRGQAAVYLIGGPKSGADSMIRAAGATDAGTAMGLDRPFTPITSEALVLAAPEVILMTTTGLESVGGVDGLVRIPGIAQTPAGRNRRVATVEDGLLFSFGPRTSVALEQLVAQIYAPRPAP
jgi:iron complex transport system substrate-binding protein